MTETPTAPATGDPAPVDGGAAAGDSPAAGDPAGSRPSPTEVAATAEARPSPTEVAATAEAVPGVVTRARRSVGGPIQTVGRRKEAIVRVGIGPGTGQIVCNGRPLADYFPSKVHQQLIKDPLVLTERLESVDINANLRGGGTTGQAGALRLAIARALCDLDLEHRPSLKKAGFLTRDARVIERKKYGLKKARKAPQYSKR